MKGRCSCTRPWTCICLSGDEGNIKPPPIPHTSLTSHSALELERGYLKDNEAASRNGLLVAKFVIGDRLTTRAGGASKRSAPWLFGSGALAAMQSLFRNRMPGTNPFKRKLP